MVQSKPKPHEARFPCLAQPSPFHQMAGLKACGESRQLLQAPSMEKRSAQQVIDRLKMLSHGWSGAVEAALSIPDELFFSEGLGTRTYSANDRADMGSFIRGLSMGRIFHPETEYGIALYETSSTVYLVLFDERRRIAVREPLLCYHSDPPEREWAKVQRSIDAAAAFAAGEEATRKGLFAVYDGTLKLVPADYPDGCCSKIA